MVKNKGGFTLLEGHVLYLIVVVFAYFLFKWVFRVLFIALLVRVLKGFKDKGEKEVNKFKESIKENT